MNAIIVSIGDELVLGQTIDTNSAWLSQQLAQVGCDVTAHLTVSDAQPAIELAIAQAAPDCDFLLISGGLGPTPDDLTRQALAAVMNVPLDLNETWLNELLAFFKARGRTMPEINRIQAMIPRGARMIFNTAGTAAGIHATLTLKPDANRKAQPAHPKCEVFVMPGVPKEMKAMFHRDVLPHIRSRSGGAVILSKTLHTFGLGESAIAEKLAELMRRDRNPSVGTTVSNGVVSLRVNARFASHEEAQAQIERTVGACRAALGTLIYGQDEYTLPDIVAQLLTLPASQLSAYNIPHSSPLRTMQAAFHEADHATVATAESCTGGLLAKYLTDIPGSSRYFQRGWITYSNEAKTDLLGVPQELIATHGAVSEPVVLAMAQGARERAGSDFALAISGIAGPEGGTAAKPVGTICIALADAAGAHARTFLFPGDREFIRDRSAKMALTLLRYRLLGEDLPF